MKIFISATSLSTSYGGPAYSVSRLSTALAEMGVEVGLWSADQSKPDWGEGSHGLAVSLLTGTAANALALFGTPDVIHDNGLWRRHNHALAEISRRREIPRIVSTRGMLEPWALRHKQLKKRVAWAAYQRKDLRSAARLHASTEEEAANLRALKLGVEVSVIPNGVDIPSALLNRTAVSAKAPRTALYLGRIYPIKGLPMLIEAWANVRPANWKLRIVGPDEAGHRAELERQVRTANLTSSVSFHPAVTGKAKDLEMRSADLFVLPTHSESFGMAVAEAMSYGLPVLTTIAAPWPALENENAGWRVAVDPDAIGKGLKEATSIDSVVLEEMGRRARVIVATDYEWGEIARRFVDLYQSTCGGRVATSSVPGREVSDGS